MRLPCLKRELHLGHVLRRISWWPALLACGVCCLGSGGAQAQVDLPGAKQEVSVVQQKAFKLPSSGAYSPSTDAEVIAKIDELIREVWSTNEVQSAKPAPDGKWCRRVFLDLLGRTPSVEELHAFIEDRRPNKKTVLVDRLLSSEYAEEYARNCAVLWTNILIGRGGKQRGGMVDRAGLQQYLREAFLKNMPYDQMAYELVTATGANRRDHAQYNGAVNFLSDKLGGAGITAASLATARTSEIFLGVRLQCVQCHNHPFNDWKQNKYWEFNSFFRQATALKRFEGGTDVAFVEVADQDFSGQSGNAEEAEVYYEGTDRLMRVSYPVFTDKDGTRIEIPRAGYLSEVNRRQELAKLIVYSQYFPDAIVNNSWARFLGFGFTKPLDDMGPHNPPAHPQLMATLSREFKDSGYNLERLVKWIVLSLPYSLDCRAASEKDAPLLGTPPLFSHFYVRQMQPEEFYESIITATEGPAHTHEAIRKRESERDEWVANLVLAQLYVTENKESTTFDGSIPQILMMFNGELTRRVTSTEPNGFLHRLANDSRMTDVERLDHMFHATLGRPSVRAEQAAIREVFLTRRGNPIAAMQDVWWSIINSNEYVLIH